MSRIVNLVDEYKLGFLDERRSVIGRIYTFYNYTEALEYGGRYAKVYGAKYLSINGKIIKLDT